MAQKLKEISKFSEDAVAVAMNTLSEEEWKPFLQGLEKIADALGDKKKTQPQQKKKQMSDEDIFKNCLMPQLRQRVAEIEIQEASGLKFGDVSPNIETNFEKCSDVELMTKHKQLVLIEDSLKTITLFIQFSRGLLYLELDKRLTVDGKTMKEFVQRGKLQVAHITVLRYMWLASFISNYPRILLCNLSMAQILKHKKRLSAYLESDDGNDLKARLSLSFEIASAKNKVNIEHVERSTPQLNFSTDPDWQFHDAVGTSAGAEGQWEVIYRKDDEEKDLLEMMNKWKTE